jgi:hypothetical protein
MKKEKKKKPVRSSEISVSFAGLYDVILQKAVLSVVTAVKASNPNAHVISLQEK